MRPPAVRLHAVTWLIWAIATAVCVHLAPNPLSVAVIIAIAWLVVEAHHTDGLLGRAFPMLLAVGAFFAVVKIVLTVLTTHGLGGVIVTLPSTTLPTLLGGFTVGGTIEDAVLAQAFAEAFAIVGIMGAFGAFNAVVSHDELVRSLPRAFHEPGVVLTVGLAFVPATVMSVRQVQESDRARTGGATVRRGRLVRMAVPVLERGMERAVLLSESMDARGFARTAPAPADRWAAVLALAGTLAVGAALLALVGGSTAPAGLATLAGVALLVGAVITASAASDRTRYRPRHLTVRDGVVIAASLLAAAGVAVISAHGNDSLVWPGLSLDAPTLDPVVLVALVPLALPAAWPSVARHEADRAPATVTGGAP